MGKKRVLVVDDDRTFLEMISTVLKKEGYEVLVSWDTYNAIEIVKTFQPDLVLIDMILPAKSGLELIKLMQKPPYKDIPVIAISGEVVDDEVRRMLLFEPNVLDYILKPLDISELLSKIEITLGKKKSMLKKKKEK